MRLSAARLALAVFASSMFMVGNAHATVPSAVAHNWRGISEFQYRLLSVARSGLGSYPTCGRTCDYLWRAQRQLDPTDPASQQLWREMYYLGYKTQLFSGFKDYWYNYGLTYGAQPVLEQNILGSWAPGDPPIQHLGTVFPSNAGGSGGQLAFPHQRIAVTGACGHNGCFESEIRAPTLGWSNTTLRADSPPPPPNSSFTTLSTGAYSQRWQGNDLVVYPDGVMYMYFVPLTFDGPPSDLPRTYGNSVQHLYTAIDPGVATAQASTVDQLTNHSEDYATLVDWLDGQLNKPDFLARQFQPKLMFDKGEKWRPLNVDTFLQERNALDGSPVQCVGPDRAHCTPVDGMATLRQHFSASDRLIQGDSLDSGAPLGSDGYRTQSTTCELTPPNASYPLQDCDSGADSSIYYNALTQGAGYNYVDYWFFYRYNEIFGGNHEADWEHVTVAQSLTDPTTFDWVNFYQHNYTNYSSANHQALDDPDRGLYLRGQLTCDAGGSGSCGDTSVSTGSRVWVYPGAGTHASYPDRCDGPCMQPNGVPVEGDHGGQAPWGRNDTLSSLLPFPERRGWASPSQGNWTDWPGKWGEQGAPSSPANNASFKCPWTGNPDDQTACTARRRKVTAHAAATRAAAHCEGWYGASVAAAACAPSALRPAVSRGKVGNRGSITLELPGGRSASTGVGIAQAAGRLLRPLDRVRVRGVRSKDTEIMLRAQYGKDVKTWVLDKGLTGSGRLVVTVPATTTGSPQVSRG